MQGVGPSCGQPVARGLSPAERALIVNLHNGLRAKVANGQETRGSNGPQPPAADMLEMVWDNEVCNESSCFSKEIEMQSYLK